MSAISPLSPIDNPLKQHSNAKTGNPTFKIAVRLEKTAKKIRNLIHKIGD
jgi:hypothetical protein